MTRDFKRLHENDSVESVEPGTDKSTVNVTVKTADGSRVLYLVSLVPTYTERTLTSAELEAIGRK